MLNGTSIYHGDEKLVLYGKATPHQAGERQCSVNIDGFFPIIVQYVANKVGNKPIKR